MRMWLYTLWIITILAGCNAGKPIPTQDYSTFAARSGASYAPERNDGEVCIWFSPLGYKEIQGLSAKIVQAPDGSIVDVSPPSWAKGEQSIILTIRNVNLARSMWRISWDVYQGGVLKQTVHVDVSPPPEVKVRSDGQEVPTRRLPNRH